MQPWKESLTLAAHLIDPKRSLAKEFDWKNTDFDEIISLLKENRVPLFNLSRIDDFRLKPFLESDHFLKALQGELRHYRFLREEYSKIREKFLEFGIEDIFIKAVDIFPYRSSNLDILVKRKDMKLAMSILESACYIEMTHYKEAHKKLYRKFFSDDRVSIIHLHCEINWGILTFLDIDLLWKRKRLSPEDCLVWLPSPEDIILINLAHTLYENHRVSLSDLRKIIVCLRKFGIDWDYLEYTVKKKNWEQGFFAAILIYYNIELKLFGDSLFPTAQISKAETVNNKKIWRYDFGNYVAGLKNMQMPFHFSKFLTAYYYFLKLLRDQERNIIKWLTKTFYIFADYFIFSQVRYRPSMLICLSGIDGSGKSTYCKALVRAFGECEIKVKYLWNRGGFSRNLELFKKMVRWLFPNSVPHPHETEKKRNMFRNTNIQNIWTLMVICDLIIHNFFSIKLPLIFGKVIICDRYIIDTFVDLAERFSCFDLDRTLIGKILIRLSPNPDISYLLEINSENALKRKRDVFPKEVLAKRNKLYHRLADRFGYDLKDVNRPLRTVKNEIVNEILLESFKKEMIK